MSRTALNIGNGQGERNRPAATESGQIAIRESSSVMIKMKLPPLTSALVTPVADPQTGSTVAMLLCTNSKSGRFATHDELFAEGAALHVGLLWLHHIQTLRLVPLPGAPLAPPDPAAVKLREQWGALCDARRSYRHRRLEMARALSSTGGAPSPPRARGRSSC